MRTLGGRAPGANRARSDVPKGLLATPRHATVAMWPRCVCVRVCVRVYECGEESS